MRIFFHVGVHKSGTTSLQDYLSANRSNWPVDFVALTKDDSVMEGVHQRVAALATLPNSMTQAAVEKAIARLTQHIGAMAPKTVFVSMESLLGKMPGPEGEEIYPHAVYLIQRLDAGFAERDVTFLFSTRDEAAWVRSLYGHRTKSRGMRMDWDTFSGLKKFADLRWDAEIARWMVGVSGSFAIRAMEDDLTEYGQPGYRFLVSAGVPEQVLERWTNVENRRRGLTDEELAFARRWWVAGLPGPIRRRVINTRFKREL